MSRVSYGQKGYVGCSRSVRACRAERNGLLPLTRAVEAVSEAAACPPSFARKCLERIGRSEWHHTGKYARRTDYYDVDKAVRMARLFCPRAARRATLARWTRQAWEEAAERRVARELLEASKGSREAEEAWLTSVEARWARRLAEIERQAQRELATARLIENYKRNPTAGRRMALEQMGVDPESLA